ncbi:hypothetical protein STRTUCAR8_00119 [Streptomyces turgidiscabies Car8]|uniref:Electron transfer flavoprotein alpha/beta-subunit N-terminal domain-containing protein n=1 Tax=Streptomyces turgidiscabies (strain Car8) TaxID=698760 RepID=L7FB54_STRT8|nr:hypothetical protein STRTUCAR8_00119 [Streptomyces turgidiscabies Car8]
MYIVDNEGLKGYLVAPKAEALQQLVERTSQSGGVGAVLIASSAEGKEVAGRLAILTGSGLITDAIDIEAGDDGPVTTQSVFAGSYTVKARVTRGVPIITVKSNSAVPDGSPPSELRQSVRSCGRALLLKPEEIDTEMRRQIAVEVGRVLHGSGSHTLPCLRVVGLPVGSPVCQVLSDPPSVVPPFPDRFRCPVGVAVTAVAGEGLSFCCVDQLLKLLRRPGLPVHVFGEVVGLVEHEPRGMDTASTAVVGLGSVERSGCVEPLPLRPPPQKRSACVVEQRHRIEVEVHGRRLATFRTIHWTRPSAGKYSSS